MIELKRTPLYDEHKALGAKIVEFGGWEMPIQYTNIIEEHHAVRHNMGIFDVSHMGEVEILGKDSADFVNLLTTNDVNKLSNGQIQYSMMCYENGGIVDDLLVYKKQKDSFLLIINAGNINKDLEWIQKQHQRFTGQCQVINVSDDMAEIAVQGPKSEAFLQKFIDKDLSQMKFFNFWEDVMLLDTQVLISRSGYTGEDGFEIYMPADKIVQFWKRLLSEGKEKGLLPCGLGARDTLRFEANLPLYGHELSENITPLEAGYDYAVDLNKPEFIGKEALVKQKERGLVNHIVGFELVDKGIARGDYPVIDEEGNQIGHVTTGYKSPTLDKTIGLAYAPFEFNEMGKKIWIKVRNKKLEAKVISRNFLNKKYKK